jgi:small subunit ribosomal protein S8e
MREYHGSKLTRKGTGGTLRSSSDKKLAKIGGAFSATKVSTKEVAVARRVRGGSHKVVRRYAITANVVMPDKSMKKVKIIRVLESPNNRHYARMNVITKGVVIETEAGKARVTSRPGQHGIVNAVLLTQ